jgi:hypothetical protein
VLAGEAVAIRALSDEESTIVGDSEPTPAQAGRAVNSACTHALPHTRSTVLRQLHRMIGCGRTITLLELAQGSGFLLRQHSRE